LNRDQTTTDQFEGICQQSSNVPFWLFTFRAWPAGAEERDRSAKPQWVFVRSRTGEEGKSIDEEESDKL